MSISPRRAFLVGFLVGVSFMTSYVIIAKMLQEAL